MNMLTKISKGYQITIPAKLRHKFGLDIGTAIDIEAKKDSIVIRPVKEELKDLFKEANKFKAHSLTAEDLEKMEDGIYE
ncbi:AbrB/MazE/SpoVT family DNA-binding domain-containing protein [Candidatus Woesearchaeota archaeon]|nr:AbrB/MazE/SpoVT family DNA-binding domain-containing protein [Candidatus Woesearchaeota archaeon]